MFNMTNEKNLLFQLINYITNIQINSDKNKKK